MVHNLGPIRVNPKGNYNNETRYKFLDMVRYNGSTWVCVHPSYVRGNTFAGIEPGSDDTYWSLEAEKGEQGPMADKYDSFITLPDGSETETDGRIEIAWDYNESDKVIIPSNVDFVNKTIELKINNVYDGCCGMIITRIKDLVLPENSDYALDFDYINIGVKQYYMYTFVYCKVMSTYRFIWNRTVIQGIEEL